jgi:dihydrofolate reductase
MEKNMTINAILAHDRNYGIGKNGGLPWPHNDADMKWFRDCTRGHVIIMGRKTWESIGYKKLSGRINVVVTRSKLNQGEDPDLIYYGDMPSLVKSLKEKYPHLKLWFIGGADLYRQALSLCDHIYTTKFPEDYNCDVSISVNDYLGGYTLMAKKERDGLEFNIWRKI